MEALAAMFENSRAGTRVTFSRHNIDYRQGNSWACHTSFRSSSRSFDIAQKIAAFLASKMIFDGAGGFRPGKRTAQFCIAPRLVLHREFTGGDTQGARALICTRSERSGLHGRLHLTCNETLCSQVADYLRMGATALVLKLADAGALRGIQLEDPMGAVQTFADDPHCAARVRRVGRPEITAVEIQRSYLDEVEAAIDRVPLPPWTREVCARWREILDLLAAGAPESVAGRLDWATKWSLFEAYRRENPSAATLFEIDTRFGDLRDGIWEQLDRDGALSHRLIADEQLAQSLSTPPADTRARLRGAAIAELFSAPKTIRERGIAAWEWVRDGRRRQEMLFPDAFDITGTWKPTTQPEDGFQGRRAVLAELLSQL
jgi:proteasome accessory factor A